MRPGPRGGGQGGRGTVPAVAPLARDRVRPARRDRVGPARGVQEHPARQLGVRPEPRAGRRSGVGPARLPPAGRRGSGVGPALGAQRFSSFGGRTGVGPGRPRGRDRGGARRGIAARACCISLFLWTSSAGYRPGSGLVGRPRAGTASREPVAVDRNGWPGVRGGNREQGTGGRGPGRAPGGQDPVGNRRPPQVSAGLAPGGFHAAFPFLSAPPLRTVVRLARRRAR